MGRGHFTPLLSDSVYRLESNTKHTQFVTKFHMASTHNEKEKISLNYANLDIFMTQGFEYSLTKGDFNTEKRSHQSLITL